MSSIPYLKEKGSLMDLTNVAVMTCQQPLKFHSQGTDVAFLCVKCGFPVLANIGSPTNMRFGDLPGNPTQCRGCHQNYWVESLPAGLQSPTSMVLHLV